MLSTSAIALSGMNAAQTSLQVSAHNIANLGTDGFRRQRVEQSTSAAGGVEASVSRVSQVGNSLETDVVDELQAKNSFLANLAVFTTNDRMTGALLDVMG